MDSVYRTKSNKIYPSTKTLHKKMGKSAKLVKYPDGRLAILINFPFDKKTIDQIKTIPNWAYSNKNWSCVLSIEAVNILLQNKFSICDKLQRYYDKFNTNSIEAIQPEGLKIELREYQKIGVGFIEKLLGRGIIADDMGLGKTPQALGFCELYKKSRPVVIVCPKTIKTKWARECKMWLSKSNPQILYSSKKEPITGDFIIVNYNILSNKIEKVKRNDGKIVYKEIPYTGLVDFIKDINPQILILDEFHKIKNEEAQQTKAVFKLAYGIPYVIGLSGTPFEKSSYELYNMVYICNPKLFPARYLFKNRYCDPKNNGFGMTYNGHSNDEELNNLLKNVMIRRLKKDYLKELPPKQFSLIPLEINNRELYEDAEDDVLSFIETQANLEFENDSNQMKKLMEKEFGKLNKKYKFKFDIHEELEDSKNEFISMKLNKALNAESFARVKALRQIATDGKIDEAFEWISDFIENNEKLVIFAKHHYLINLLMERFKNVAVKIDGTMSEKQRLASEDSFQTNKKTKIIVISEAAAEGLNLTAASNIAILEFPWNPGKLRQIIDRIHRIGQLHQVTVYYLVAINTVEERFAEILDSKTEIQSIVLDGKKVSESDLILELINSLGKRKLKTIKK